MKYIGVPNRGWFGLLLIVVLPTSTTAQSNRIAGRINTSQWTALKGNVHPNARSEYDQGKADASLQMSSVTLVLRPSGTQQAALERLLADRQDPASANHRRWLTPDEYADSFGLAQSDVDKIAGWAQSQRLKVTGVARARNAVTLTGSAVEVGTAFHTEIHLYRVNGETHYANATEPSVPAAMQDVVAAIHGLHDFRLRSKARKLVVLGSASDGVSPAYTSSTTGNHYLAPDDFATIFNVNPLYSAGINGSSQKIVIVGQSQIVTSHLSTFSAYFGMPAVNLTTILVPNTQDPGISESDEQESDLDLQWSSAVARGASLVFVYSYDVTDAVRYAIDQNLAPVISMSYGECEESATRTDAATMRAWAQQANAQGITWVTASGDSGAANCYQASSGPFGSANGDLTVAVDLPASIPEVTGIGGTTFSEGSDTYWNTTNSATRASAQGYIPEVAWNDSISDGSPAASGGGASQFFAKPSWQTGAGVPNDGARDVPDLAFPASPHHDGYLVYTTSGRQTTWYVFGGTSCGTPAFSGVLSLLNQYLVSGGRQRVSGLGNINSTLYALASSTPAAFHDVTTGNNIVVATCTGRRCAGTTTSGGYSAGAGYDLVTGLGSLDVNAFITAWYAGGASFRTTPTLVVGAAPDTLTTSGSTILTATVANANGKTPTGTVTFSAGAALLGTATLSGGSGSAMAQLSITGSAAGIASGANTISAVYEGDSDNNAATSTVVLTVNSLSSAIPSITGLTNAASYQQSYAPGMVLSVFGSNLALSTSSAASVPLPTLLDNISLTVDGIAAPFYFASPTQLNVQLPYETRSSGTATVVVANNGETASRSIPMAPAASGIFTDTSGAIAPTSTASRGRTAAIYVTGAGALQPAVATGAVPGSGAIPIPTQTLLVTVGGVQATTTYIRVPSWSIGILQINFTVPSSVSTGTQSVIVSVGGLASAAATMNIIN